METVSATEFKAKCLELLDRVGARQIGQLAITKRRKVVAMLRLASFRMRGWNDPSPRGNRAGLRFLPDVKVWFARIMARPGIREAALTPDIAVDASCLPGELHADPADRPLIATARYLSVPLVTRDARIIAYAARDFLGVLPC